MTCTELRPLCYAMDRMLGFHSPDCEGEYPKYWERRRQYWDRKKNRKAPGAAREGDEP